MKRLDEIKAICFDLDDTLCGYWDASKSAMRTAFDAIGPEGVSVDEMVQAWAKAFRTFSPTVKGPKWYPTYLKQGEPTRTELMRLALLEVGFNDADRAKRLGDLYSQERDRNLKLFPDALPVLDELKTRYPLGLITNGPADVQRQEIETLKIGRYFGLILIEGEMGEGKPERAVFHRAERYFDVLPDNILFVGNSYAHDIQPALEAGWHAVWIRRDSDIPPSSDGKGHAHELRPEGSPEPDAEISELSELLGLLQG